MTKPKTPAPDQQLRAALVQLHRRLAYEAAEFQRAVELDCRDPLPPEGETEHVTEDGRVVTTFFLPERAAGLVERWRAPHVIQQLERAALRLCPAAGWMAGDCRGAIRAATGAHETLLSTWSDEDAFEQNLVTQNAAWLRLGRLAEELSGTSMPAGGKTHFREMRASPAASDNGRPGATVEARMLDLIVDAATHEWTAQRFADRLGCSKTAVVETQAWKRLAVAREAARLQRVEREQKRGHVAKADRRRRPKGRRR